MNEIKDNKDTKPNSEQNVHFEDHREKDRRKELSKGFAYISTVGWICRREIIRRKDDPFIFS